MTLIEVHKGFVIGTIVLILISFILHLCIKIRNPATNEKGQSFRLQNLKRSSKERFDDTDRVHAININMQMYGLRSLQYYS